MARSDNVVRAGLTPKVRDVATLIKIIKYNPTSIENLKFYATYFDKFISIYKPPVNDFALARICVSIFKFFYNCQTYLFVEINLQFFRQLPREQMYTLPMLKTASLLFVLSGTAENEYFDIETGMVLFLPSEFIITLTVTSDVLEMYQAHANV